MRGDDFRSCSYDNCMKSLSTIYHCVDLSLHKNLQSVLFPLKFDEISSLHIIRYLHLTSHYLTCKIYWNHLLQNSPRGKLSSIFVSEIIRTSIFPLTWSISNLNWFLSDSIFIRPKTDLFVFSQRIDFKIGLASIIFLSSSEKLDFHLSWFNLEFSPT